MHRLNEFIGLVVTGLALSCAANAAELLIFDSPNMIMLQDRGRLAGYYNSVEGNKSCEFFFYQTMDYSGGDEEYPAADIKSFSFTFPPKSYQYKDRDKNFDSAGEVYGQQDQRIVRIAAPEPGCVGWAVGSFEKRPSDKDVVRYTVENGAEAIGIRALSKKSTLYRKNGSRFDATRMYLVMGDVVVVIKTANDYSYIRYTNPDSTSEGRVTTGWVHSADLVNPFPPASKELKP